MNIEVGAESIAGRAKRLRAATHAAHERLDGRIMAGRPFDSRENYGKFLAVQYLFHRDIDALYHDRILKTLLPDLSERRRLGQIVQDIADLGQSKPGVDAAPAFLGTVDVPTALGWLYVSEGSNLGAAFLLKEAAKLGLGEEFGARHLAGHPEGRGLNWRKFTTALDAAELAVDEEARAVKGAIAAFERVHGLVERQFA